MRVHRQLEDYEQEELEEFLAAPINLTAEATELTKKFNDLMEQTTHVGNALNVRIR